MSKYLISKTADSLFALLIGTTAAWTRIRREETERFRSQLSQPVSDPSQEQPGISPASSASAPTATDTLATFSRRIRNVNWDPRAWEFEWRDLWKKRESFGIVDPNER